MKKILLLMIPVALIAFQSCNKGCIDPNASNYSEDAKKDDGNCTYEATLTLWFSQSKSIAWDQSGVTGLNVYVGGVLVGSGNYDVNDYDVTPPTCAEAGNIVAVKNMGSDMTKTFTWEVKDQGDVLLDSGTWDATGGGCDVVEVP